MNWQRRELDLWPGNNGHTRDRAHVWNPPLHRFRMWGSRAIEAVARKHGFTRLADAFQMQSAALD
jgi:hypothetical protein